MKKERRKSTEKNSKDILYLSHRNVVSFKSFTKDYHSATVPISEIRKLLQSSYLH